MGDLTRGDVEPIERPGPKPKGSKRARKAAAERREAKRTAKQIRYSKVRQDVESRADGRCELRTPKCTHRGVECHHLLMRSLGGKDEIANCVWTCRECHEHTHLNESEAYANGWLRKREVS